jgi:hypothetical protein
MVVFAAVPSKRTISSWFQHDFMANEGTAGPFGFAQDRLFDSVWRKNAPNSAQDDISYFGGGQFEFSGRNSTCLRSPLLGHVDGCEGWLFLRNTNG